MAAGVTPQDDAPPRPWFPIQGTKDATTMWYAVMRKEVKAGVFIAQLCLRHSEHQASLEAAGYAEVAVDEIGRDLE